MYRTKIFVVALLAVSCGALSQQVPPNIVTEGVPEVPRELVKKLNPYQNLRGAAFSSWHPSRREILIRTRFADTLQVHLKSA